MAAISYMTVGSNDLEKAKGFYDVLLGTIGMRGVFEHPSGGRLYAGRDTGMFGVLGPADGKSASDRQWHHGRLQLRIPRGEVDAFYAKALDLGPGPMRALLAPAARRPTSPISATSTATSCAATRWGEASKRSLSTHHGRACPGHSGAGGVAIAALAPLEPLPPTS